MKKLSLLMRSTIALSLLGTAIGCKQMGTMTTPATEGYTPPSLTLSSDVMTPEILWSFGRLSGATLSPDGKDVLYAVTFFNKEEDKGYTDLYLKNIETGNEVRLTNTKTNEAEASWSANGEKIRFIAEGQLWEMDRNGGNRVQLSDIEGGIGGYLFAPDESKVVFLKDVKLEPTVQDMYPDLPKANARIIDNQFYRHWDQWVDAYTHPFVAVFDGKSQITTGTDIMEGEHWESPVRPWGGIEQLAWTKDGENVIYTARKKEGLEYARSTNTDLYRYNVATKETTNLTEGMMGYDKNPVISPSGRYMAWESQEREGYEADQVRLFVMDLMTGEKSYVTKGFDRDASSYVWESDSVVYFVTITEGTQQIYQANIQTKTITPITKGVHDFNAIISTGDEFIAQRNTMSAPAELFVVNKATGDYRPFTTINKALMDQLTMGRVEERWIETSDKKQMLVWVIYPPHFDASKKYPTLLYCEGGPQSPVSQFWSYRWNFQMMAANGYIIVAPNRRGLPGFGQAWNEQISGDYSGQNITDYLTAIDAISKEPYVDNEHLGCVGASYGGYSVYYLAGKHNKRFKAFIAHCGIYNLESQYELTEEMWFADWDMGGSPWDKDNKVAQRTYANSPHKFVGNWDTPILVIHGQKDFRIDASQGMSAFNSARMRGIPARYLYFPEECHWVTSCQDGILWQRVFFNWLDRWLKPQNDTIK